MLSYVNPNEVIRELTTTARRPGGNLGHPVVASSVCKIVLGMLFNTRELGHAPEPNGFPGGYPIKIGSKGVDVFLPGDVTLDYAVKINNEGQVFEGVKSIEEDGSVVLTDKSARIFKDLLDFDCSSYTIDNCEAKAQELGEEFKKWA